MPLFGGDPTKEAIQRIRDARAGIPLPDIISQRDSDPGGYAGEQLAVAEGRGFADDPNQIIDAPPSIGADQVVKDVAGANSPEPAAPQRETMQRRGPRQAPWDPDRNYTNADFYGPERPRFSFTDPRGVQLEVPKAGQLPMGIWASRAGQVGGELQQTRKAIADLMSDTKVNPTADPYQVSFDKHITDWENNFISGITQQYQGDDFEAMKETSTPGTDAHTKWMQGHKALDAIGQYVKNEWAESAGWIKEAMNGKLHMPPWMAQEAYDVFNGLGSMKSGDTGGDFVKLAKRIDKLRYYQNLSTFDKEFILPHAQEIYAKIEDEPVYEVHNGKQVIKTRTTEEVQDAFYDAATEEALKISPGLDEKETREYFEYMYPKKKSDTLTIQAGNLPSSGGSDGSKGGNTGVGTNVRVDFRPLTTNQGGTSTVASAGEKTLLFTPFQSTGGKEHTVKEIVVSGGVDTPDIPMRDVALVYRPGKKDWVLVGQSLIEQGRNELQKVTGGEGGGLLVPGDAGYEEQEAKAAKETEKIWSTYRQQKIVPAASNSSVLESYWGAPNPVVATAKIAGVKPEEMERLVKTESGRTELARKMGLPVGDSAPAKTATPTQQALAGEWEAMRAANPGMTPKQVTDAINKKYNLR